MYRIIYDMDRRSCAHHFWMSANTAHQFCPISHWIRGGGEEHIESWDSRRTFTRIKYTNKYTFISVTQCLDAGSRGDVSRLSIIHNNTPSSWPMSKAVINELVASESWRWSPCLPLDSVAKRDHEKLTQSPGTGCVEAAQKAELRVVAKRVNKNGPARARGVRRFYTYAADCVHIWRLGFVYGKESSRMWTENSYLTYCKQHKRRWQQSELVCEFVDLE